MYVLWGNKQVGETHMGKRLKFGLLALPVMALACTCASPAPLQPEMQNNPLRVAKDPQTANIPYLAWAGNQVGSRSASPVRKPVATSRPRFQIPTLNRGKFVVEDWSGYELTGGGSDGSVNTRQRTPTRSSSTRSTATSLARSC